MDQNATTSAIVRTTLRAIQKVANVSVNEDGWVDIATKNVQMAIMVKTAPSDALKICRQRQHATMLLVNSNADQDTSV